uniref:Uncharacterized protein n=1 Tax=Siphoviridae sp. ctdYc1 TaxID=2826399 RepID=A0A8S5N0F9_9CAUD|nr:MAG TPA: hypothetical protein [Siphoviridae sp. ctdYc1]
MLASFNQDKLKNACAACFSESAYLCNRKQETSI